MRRNPALYHLSYPLCIMSCDTLNPAHPNQTDTNCHHFQTIPAIISLLVSLGYGLKTPIPSG